MNHQTIKFPALLFAVVLMFLVVLLDITSYSIYTKFLRTLFAIPVSLMIIFLGSVYSNLFKRKNELSQILKNLLISCYAFFIIGSLWLIGFIFFRGLLDFDFHFFSNQILIKNLKKYLFYTVIIFQIIAFVFALLFDIAKTGESSNSNQ